MHGQTTLFTKKADHYTITLDLFQESGGLPIRVLVRNNHSGEAHFIGWARTQLLGYRLYEMMIETYDI